MDKVAISAVVLTRDEEKNLESCLGSLDFCEEVIIVDDGSTDKTEEIAKKYSAKIYRRALADDYASQRNWAMEKASHDWILFVDADEQVSKDLRKNLTGIIEKSNQFSTYYIKRRDFFWGRELRFGETHKIRSQGLIRLVKKNAGHWVGQVHETFYTDKAVGRLSGYLDHYPHQTVREFIKDVNRYSSIRAKELDKQGVKANIFTVCFLPLGKFILNYWLKLGVFDGVAGFIYAFFMSFHSFLVRAKLYQYQLRQDHG